MGNEIDDVGNEMDEEVKKVLGIEIEDCRQQSKSVLIENLAVGDPFMWKGELHFIIWCGRDKKIIRAYSLRSFKTISFVALNMEVQPVHLKIIIT